MVHWFLVVTLGMWAGCTGCAQHAGAGNDGRAAVRAVAEGEPKAATLPAAGEPVPLAWETVKLVDAKPLLKMQASGETTDLAYKIATGGDEADTLYFGEIQNGDEQYMPIVATKHGKTFKAVKVLKAFGDDQWSKVVSGPHRGEFWGILDQSEDNRGPALGLVHSTDNGKAMHVASLPKVCDQATFYDIVMAKNGHGRLTMALDQDCGEKLKAGLYHYRTTDGGKTWTAPEFEPDATKPADDVPDEEQPGEGQMSA